MLPLETKGNGGCFFSIECIENYELVRELTSFGTGVVKQFALDMRQAFPNETGFSYSNVKYMKQWYSFYYERVTKGQQPIGLIGHQAGGQLEVIEKGQQVADQINGVEKKRPTSH